MPVATVFLPRNPWRWRRNLNYARVLADVARQLRSTSPLQPYPFETGTAWLHALVISLLSEKRVDALFFFVSVSFFG